MLALLWLLYFSFGLIHRSTSPLITPILRDLHMSYGQMGLVLGSWQLTYLVFAVLAGIMIDRWGVRNSLFVGTMVIGLSADLRYFADGFGTFFPIVAMFGVGGPLISIGGPKAIAQWFRGKDRGLAVGIYMTGPWIGGMFALSATNRFIMPLTGYSWRLTFVCYGLVALGIALLWWFLAKEASSSGTDESVGIMEVFLGLIKVPNVRMVLLSGLLAFAINHGYTNWLPKILEGKGMSPSMAGITASLPLLAGIPAVLALPALIPARFRVMVPLLILNLMDTPEVDSKYLGSAGGIFYCISDFGGFMGPLVVGALVDLTGTFISGAFFLIGLCLVIFSMTFILKPRPVLDSGGPL
jgi:MFS family permease